MSEEEFDEDFFEKAFKILDIPKDAESGENKEAGESQFKLRSIEKKPEESPRILDPDHPLLEKFQKALKEHLLKQIDHLNEEIFNYESNTKKKDAAREKLGIEAYETQQMVCKQQKTIEEYMTEIENVTAAQEELEHQLVQATDEFTKARNRLFEAEKKERELVNEVESLDLLITQMSKWEKEQADELRANQRISEKTKKDKLKLASDKRDLDMVIYKRMTDIWRLENEMETMNMQLRVKEEERERLALAVALSNTDIEGLETENKCLLNSWNSVIAAIVTRDKNYVALQNELKGIDEQIKNSITEIEQIKKLCKKEMRTNEMLTMFKNRVEADIKNCMYLLEQEIKKREELEAKINGIHAIIEETDRTFEKICGENCRKEIEYTHLLKEFEKTSYDKVAWEEKVLNLLQDQITNDKAASYLSKIARQIREKNTDMEITLATSENQNAKVQMDIEAQKYMNEQSDRMLVELGKQEYDLDAEINKITHDMEKYQFVMRRKQREFDILNKKYEIAKEKSSSASGSTYETQMLELEKEIEETEQTNKNLQKFWLREQENMVVMTQQRQEQIRDNNLIRKQILILDQKNLKIGDELEALKKQEDKMNRSITALLTKQTMLQEAFNQKKGNKEGLDRDNIITQTEYLGKLQDAELEALSLESEMQDMEEAKLNLSKDLIEKNREALAWEKKIQLVMETKQNIDKEKGIESEVGNMRAEIHRMNVRYSQLKKAQEKLIHDLESCIIRREAIVTEAEARDRRIGKASRPKIQFQKKLDDYRNKIKKVEMEIEQVNKDLDALNEEEQKMKGDINEMEANIYNLEERIDDSKEMIEEAKTDKQKTLETLVLKQKKLNMYHNLVKKRPVKLLFRSESLLDMELQRQRDIHQKLMKILDDMLMDYPHFKHQFSRIANTLKIY